MTLRLIATYLIVIVIVLFSFIHSFKPSIILLLLKTQKYANLDHFLHLNSVPSGHSYKEITIKNVKR